MSDHRDGCSFSRRPSKDLAALTSVGTLFHSLGPWTANDPSFSVWLLEALKNVVQTFFKKRTGDNVLEL